VFLIIKQTAGRWLQLCLDGLTRKGSTNGRFWRRILIMLLLIPVSVFGLLFHWSFLLLDELLFRGYRKVCIRAPVFVTGVPRSGTTFLHRVLATDPQFTTFSTWECLFAPSITQKKLILALARLDAKWGGVLKRGVDKITAAVTQNLNDIHATQLEAPEEDYFVFMPLLLCFILVVVFPGSEFIWRMGFFDKAMSVTEKRRLMGYYRACLQKHLYVYGEEKTLLSKNASFASLVHSLADEFPDARFIYCLRDPQETLPSQLSSLRGAMLACGNDPDSAQFRDRMVELLSYYYENLLQVISEPKAGTRQSVINMETLKNDLRNSINAIYQQLGLSASGAFQSALAGQAKQASGFRSQHAYSARQFGYDEKIIKRRFAHVYEHPDFQQCTSMGESSRQSAGQKLAGGTRC
jgi:hypothetical protein